LNLLAKYDDLYKVPISISKSLNNITQSEFISRAKFLILSQHKISYRHLAFLTIALDRIIITLRYFSRKKLFDISNRY